MVRLERLERGEEQLREWVASLIGPGRPWETQAQMSLRLGLSAQTVSNILRRGRADIETLVKLAQGTGTPLLVVLEVALGFDEGGLASSGGLSPEDYVWVARYHQLSPIVRRVVDGIIERESRGEGA